MWYEIYNAITLKLFLGYLCIQVYDIWRERHNKRYVFGKLGSSDMMDEDVFALFPGNWFTDKV